MVSLITEGSSSDPKGRPFRRRRTLPYVIMALVLALVATGLWIRVLTVGEESDIAVACNAPTAPADGSPTPELGTVVDASTMLDIQPAAVGSTRVRVYNANGQRGQASTVAAELSDMGFASAPDVQAGNDPIYVDQNMQCQGQIRFGEQGRAAAATVALAARCTEFVLDGRTDDTVDLALGTYFRDLQPNADAVEVLRILADTPINTTPPPVDMGLLEAARHNQC